MSRGEVGDTLQYLEAASSASAASGSGSRGHNHKVSRTKSSNALVPPVSRGGGLNPSALFTVAAMATAPVGTTVIEDEEPEEAVMMADLSGKALVERPPFETTSAGDADFDLCEQCTRKRKQRARIKQQQTQEHQQV